MRSILLLLIISATLSAQGIVRGGLKVISTGDTLSILRVNEKWDIKSNADIDILGVDTLEANVILQNDTALNDLYVRIGSEVDLTSDITIGTTPSNYLKINSTVYLDTTGMMGNDTVILIGVKQGDSTLLRYMDKGEILGVDTTGLPVAGQIAFFTGANKIGGNSGFLFTGSTRTAGAFYTGTTNPTNINRLNYDGYLYSTSVTGSSTTVEGIYGQSTSTTHYGIYANGGLRAKLNSDNNSKAIIYGHYNYLSGTTPISQNLIQLTRDISGTADVTANIINITDNPTTSGAVSGKVLSATIGTTERISLNPRATGTAFGYLFDTHSTIDSILDIRNNGVSQFKITSEGVHLPTKPQTGTFNLVLKDGVVDTAKNPSIKVHRIDSINTTTINAWVDVKFDTLVAVESSYGLAFNSDSTGIISSASGLFQAKGCGHWIWNGGAPGSHKLYIRVTVNGVEKRCLQANDTRSNATGDDGTLPYMGTIRIVPNDEIKIQYYVTSADLDFEGDAVFDNPIAFSFNMFKISD